MMDKRFLGLGLCCVFLLGLSGCHSSQPVEEPIPRSRVIPKTILYPSKTKRNVRYLCEYIFTQKERQRYPFIKDSAIDFVHVTKSHFTFYFVNRRAYSLPAEEFAPLQEGRYQC